MSEKNNNTVCEYSVVMPVFNEIGILDELYRRVTQVMDALHQSYEIIFVDDGSSDGSTEKLTEIALSDLSVRTILLDGNYGQHPALIAGFAVSRGRVVITLDADLQDLPEEIPSLLAVMKQGYDMVVGRRTDRKHALVRRIVSRMANIVLSVVGGVRLYDYGNMLRVFKRTLVEELIVRYDKERLFIPVLAARITRNVCEHPVEHAERVCGKSKYSLPALFCQILGIMVKSHGRLYAFFCAVGLMKKNELYRIKKIVERVHEQ